MTPTQFEAELAASELDHERQAMIKELMPRIAPGIGAPLVRMADSRCIVIDSARPDGLVLSVTKLFPYMATRGHYHGYEETMLVLEGGGQLITGDGHEVSRAIMVTPGFARAFGSLRSHRVVAGEHGMIFLNTFRVTDEADETVYL